jgi:hypothetical protein
VSSTPTQQEGHQASESNPAISLQRLTAHQCRQCTFQQQCCSWKQAVAGLAASLCSKSPTSDSLDESSWSNQQAGRDNQSTRHKCLSARKPLCPCAPTL